MAYNDQTTRNDASALIPVEVATEIIQGIAEKSAVMQLATRLPNMTAKQRRMPILTMLPHAYFVDGDTGFKQTTKMAWDNKFLEAEEIATIVPVAESVFNDSEYDLWTQVRPRIEAAMGALFDRAVFYGEGAPASWPQNVVAGATAAGNKVVLGTATDYYQDLMGEDGLIAKVEEDGFFINGHVGAMSMRAKLRGITDTSGQPIFRPMVGMQGKTAYELDGAQVITPTNGSIDPVKSLMVSGDWSQLVYAIRQDITYKLLDQAVITDNTGNVLYNLAQQDMVAMRVVMRLAWQLPNPINMLQQDATKRYPFAVLTA